MVGEDIVQDVIQMFVRYPVEVVPWIGVDTTVVVGAEETYLVRLWFAVSL